MKPDKPIVYNEFYLDAMTGGSPELPAPVTPEQHYLAHLAGMTVTLPHPIILRDKFLAKICGMDVDIPTYIPGKFPRKFAYYAKAAGQDVDVPQPITREEMYWFDYVSGQPTPSEQEYTGAVPVTFTANGQPLLDYLISGNTVQSGTPTPDNPVMPQGTGERTGNLIKIRDFTATTNPTSQDGVLWSGTLAEGTYTFSIHQDDTLTSSLRNTIHIKIGSTNYYENSSANYHNNSGRHNYIFTVPDDTTMVEIRYWTNAISDDCSFSQGMLNSGSTALPYEPYGYFIEIEVS